MSIILSVIMLSIMPFSAYAVEDDDYEISRFTGYYFDDCMDAIGFYSWSDYLTYSQEANKRVKGDDYIDNYDYIYVPSLIANETENISQIFITPRYCKITYDINGENIDTSYYFIDDNKSESHEYSLYGVTEGRKKTSSYGIDYYEYNHEYYCNYDGKFFSFSSSLDINDMGSVPFVKVYIDKHIQENDGNLYYMNDNNEPQSGWKTINGHKYYFRSSDKTAVCGKVKKINGIVYIFNTNGICKGKYTGYALQQDGTKVYYKDGIVPYNFI